MNLIREQENTVQCQIYQELLRIFRIENSYGEERNNFLEIFPVRINADEEERLIAAARTTSRTHKKKGKTLALAEFMERYPLVDADDKKNQAAFKMWQSKQKKRVHQDDNDDNDDEADQKAVKQPRITVKPPATLQELIASLQQSQHDLARTIQSPQWEAGRVALHRSGIFGTATRALMQEVNELNAKVADLNAKTTKFEEQTVRLVDALNPAAN